MENRMCSWKRDTQAWDQRESHSKGIIWYDHLNCKDRIVSVVERFFIPLIMVLFRTREQAESKKVVSESDWGLPKDGIWIGWSRNAGYLISLAFHKNRKVIAIYRALKRFKLRREEFQDRSCLGHRYVLSLMTMEISFFRWLSVWSCSYSNYRISQCRSIRLARRTPGYGRIMCLLTNDE